MGGGARRHPEAPQPLGAYVKKLVGKLLTSGHTVRLKPGALRRGAAPLPSAAGGRRGRASPALPAPGAAPPLLPPLPATSSTITAMEGQQEEHEEQKENRPQPARPPPPPAARPPVSPGPGGRGRGWRRGRGRCRRPTWRMRTARPAAVVAEAPGRQASALTAF